MKLKETHKCVDADSKKKMNFCIIAMQMQRASEVQRRSGRLLDPVWFWRE
jgi:hypothetical protein